MKNITKKILSQKSKTIPILSFPSVSLLGITVKDLVTSPTLQADALEAINKRCAMGALVTPMDLSVEAECFGAPIKFSDDEVPAVISPILEDICDAEELAVPDIGSGRSAIFTEGIRLSKERLPDTLIFGGAIGPYSLASRLFDMTSLMMECYDDPDSVKILLEKVTEFLIKYINAQKAAGSDGVILAEPAAGLLSPSLCEEFSDFYVKKIVDAVSDDSFIFCYHNCGGSVPSCIDSIVDIGADIYHFGNAIKLSDVIEKIPENSLVMGNVDPLIFKDKTPQDIRAAVNAVFAECSGFDRFMISSGCDIPFSADWQVIDEYFAAVGELYD